MNTFPWDSAATAFSCASIHRRDWFVEMTAFYDSDDPDRSLTEAEAQLAEGLSFEDRLEIDRTLLERLEGEASSRDQ